MQLELWETINLENSKRNQTVYLCVCVWHESVKQVDLLVLQSGLTRIFGAVHAMMLKKLCN